MIQELSQVPIKYAYIDPGTGSMLFTLLFGILGVLSYSLRSIISRISLGFGDKTSSKNRYPFVIYTDSKRYWNVFKPICDEFENNMVNLVYLTQSEDDPVFSEKYNYISPEYIGNNNKSFSRLNFLNADILLSTTPSLDVYQWKRSKGVKFYIHVPHACTDVTLYRIFGTDYYDAMLLSGQYQIDQIRELEKQRNIKEKDMKIVGLTYFDALKERLKKAKRKNNDNTLVLLAPSWGPSSLLNLYGSELIDELISTGFDLVIRPHPQSYISEKELMKKLIKQYPNVIWNTDNDNFDILNSADIMISDFSGVIYDFALVFNNPVIYANNSFDDSVYDAHWLEEKTWAVTNLPLIGRELKKEEFKNIRHIIEDCLNNSNYEENRRRLINEAWENRGNASKAIFDYMHKKQEELNAEN